MCVLYIKKSYEMMVQLFFSQNILLNYVVISIIPHLVLAFDSETIQTLKWRKEITEYHLK